MKIAKFFSISMLLACGLVSMAHAQELSGTYEETRGSRIELTSIQGNSYRINSNQSKFKQETGHEWSGSGMTHQSRFIGVIKYPDNDTKYFGLAAYCEGEISISNSTCITLTCLPIKGKLSFGDQFNGAKYCKMQ